MKKIFTLAIMGLAMTSMPFGAMASEHISPVSVENSDCLGARSDNIYTGDEDVNKWEITYKREFGIRTLCFSTKQKT